MVGFPKWLNSKDDYENILKTFPKEVCLPHFKALVDDYYGWFFVKNLDKKEDGINDETHKVETMEDNESGVETYAQYEKQINKTCKLLSVGYTLEEVERVIKELE